MQNFHYLILNRMVSKKEFIIIIFISIIVLVLALSPLIFGYLHTPSDSVLGGLGRDDEYVYVHYLRQAKEGRWTFHNLYTQEEHQPIFSLLPLLLLGKLSALTGVDVFVIYNLGRFVYGLSFLLIAYLFITDFVKKRFYRILAFIILCFSSGFGWLWAFSGLPLQVRSHLALANYVSEATTFPSLLFYPHFPISVALMLLCFYFFLKSLRKNSWILLVFSGIFGALVVQSHPYEIVTLAVVPLVFLFLQQSNNLKNWFFYAVFIVLLLPAGLYYFWLSATDPVYKAWIEIPQLSPPIIDFFLAYGFLFIPLGYGMAVFLKERKIANVAKDRYLFLLFWIVATVFLMRMPFRFQRRLIMGVHVPISLLAAAGLFIILDKLRGKGTKIIICAIFLLAVVPQNIYYISQRIKELQETPQHYYISKKTIALLSWLEQNTASNAVILSDPSTSLLIPPFSGRRVYLGYWANTLQVEQRVADFFKFTDKKTSDSQRKTFLTKTQTLYYLQDNQNNHYNIYQYQAERSKPSEFFDPSQVDYLEQVFANDAGVVYKINLN